MDNIKYPITFHTVGNSTIRFTSRDNGVYSDGQKSELKVDFFVNGHNKFNPHNEKDKVYYVEDITKHLFGETPFGGGKTSIQQIIDDQIRKAAVEMKAPGGWRIDKGAFTIQEIVTQGAIEDMPLGASIIGIKDDNGDWQDVSFLLSRSKYTTTCFASRRIMAATRAKPLPQSLTSSAERLLSGRQKCKDNIKYPITFHTVGNSTIRFTSRDNGVYSDGQKSELKVDFFVNGHNKFNPHNEKDKVYYVEDITKHLFGETPFGGGKTSIQQIIDDQIRKAAVEMKAPGGWRIDKGAFTIQEIVTQGAIEDMPLGASIIGIKDDNGDWQDVSFLLSRSKYTTTCFASRRIMAATRAKPLPQSLTSSAERLLSGRQKCK
ncbi:UNVERIFIED_ASMBLY: hypothetical protein SD1_58 [Shigella phage 2019SD1]|uniref:Uncharacterized protein n=1 Tax=Shigella phage 2019SD1 TaxID=2848074 RepID=A0A6M5CCR1_9CAUD|nr:hypothetical protein H1N84_gp57 [Shigella phage 2019SD1]